MQQRRFIRTLQNAALTLGLGLASAGALAQAAPAAPAAAAIPPTWAQGRTPEQATLDEMEALWIQAKHKERETT